MNCETCKERIWGKYTRRQCECDAEQCVFQCFSFACSRRLRFINNRYVCVGCETFYMCLNCLKCGQDKEGAANMFCRACWDTIEKPRSKHSVETLGKKIEEMSQMICDLKQFIEDELGAMRDALTMMPGSEKAREREAVWNARPFT